MARWPEGAMAPSDAILAAAAGDEEALSLLLLSYAPLLRHLLAGVPVQRRGDVLAEIQLRLLAALRAYRPTRLSHPRLRRTAGTTLRLRGPLPTSQPRRKRYS